MFFGSTLSTYSLLIRLFHGLFRRVKKNGQRNRSHDRTETLFISAKSIFYLNLTRTLTEKRADPVTTFNVLFQDNGRMRYVHELMGQDLSPCLCIPTFEFLIVRRFTISMRLSVLLDGWFVLGSWNALKSGDGNCLVV